MAALDIIYEDNYLVVVNKAAGMLTVADRFQQESVHLQSILRNKYGQIFTIHRLDRETSGIICFAKDAETHRLLSQIFEEREVEKYYAAFVEGCPPIEGIINEPLAMSETRPGTMKVYKKGKPSLTTFELVKSFQSFSHLRIRIHTGRMHQIRVHLAFIGFPLFIDSLYGRRTEFKLSELKGKKYRIGKFGEEEKPLISRLTLHAEELSFIHPHTNEKIKFQAALPKDMKALIQQAEKANK